MCGSKQCVGHDLQVMIKSRRNSEMYKTCLSKVAFFLAYTVLAARGIDLLPSRCTASNVHTNPI
jgi:hypothetical protein